MLSAEVEAGTDLEDVMLCDTDAASSKKGRGEGMASERLLNLSGQQGVFQVAGSDLGSSMGSALSVCRIGTQPCSCDGSWRNMMA